MGERHGPAGLAAYLRCGLAALIRRRGEASDVPGGIAAERRELFDEMLTGLSGLEDTYFTFGRLRHPLEKDLAVAAGAAWPIGGAWLVEERWVDTRPRASVNVSAAPRATATRARYEVRGWYQWLRLIKRRRV